MTSPGTRPVTVRVRRAERVVDIAFDDGAAFQLSAEFLRVESPSAEVQGHGGPKQLVPGKGSVGITAVEPVGHYAIRICFDDGHDSGSGISARGRPEPRTVNRPTARLGLAGVIPGAT